MCTHWNWLIIIEEKVMLTRMPLISPGEILKEEFMIPLGLDEKTLSNELQIPLSALEAILYQRHPIRNDMARLLGCRFKTPPEFWLNLQQQFENRARQYHMDLPKVAEG